MPLRVKVRTDVEVTIDDEDTLRFLRALVANPAPEHQHGEEPEHIRIHRGEVFSACDKALQAIESANNYG